MAKWGRSWEGQRSALPTTRWVDLCNSQMSVTKGLTSTESVAGIMAWGIDERYNGAGKEAQCEWEVMELRGPARSL